MTSTHILRLPDRSIIATVVEELDEVRVLISSTKPDTPSTDFELIFYWYAAILDADWNDGRSCHVFDPAHVLTT